MSFSPELLDVIAFYCRSEMLFLRRQAYSLHCPLMSLFRAEIIKAVFWLRDMAQM